MPSTRRQFVISAAAASAALGAPRVFAAAYPERPITFICPWAPGGTADVAMRALCGAAAKELGQTIVVENKAGASGMIGLRAVASAVPDGYTIGQVPISVTRFAQLPGAMVDPLKDLTYLARTSGQTFGIAVRNESPLKTLGDMVTAAKANPGKVTYASAGVGGATHVGMEEFLAVANIQMNHIPYKGGAPALVDLLGGQVDVLADSSSWAPHVKSGKLRLLATWGEKRTNDFAQVPTLREAGYDVVVDAPNGVAAPRGIPPAIETRLRDALRAAVASADFTSACARLDAPVMYQDAPEYAKFIEASYRKETQLIDRLKLREMLRG
jgi:tripartite-type tricarboxylate transporter receptor subunit TctC